MKEKKNNIPGGYKNLSEENKKKVNKYREKKLEAVKNQNYEKAAKWRKKERQTLGTWEKIM